MTYPDDYIAIIFDVQWLDRYAPESLNLNPLELTLEMFSYLAQALNGKRELGQSPSLYTRNKHSYTTSIIVFDYRGETFVLWILPPNRGITETFLGYQLGTKIKGVICFVNNVFELGMNEADSEVVRTSQTEGVNRLIEAASTFYKPPMPVLIVQFYTTQPAAHDVLLSPKWPIPTDVQYEHCKLRDLPTALQVITNFLNRLLE